VEDKLKAGAKIADIGCGLGSSSILMAQTYPKSTVHGFYFHGPSIEKTKAKAAEAGLGNIEFHEVAAKDFIGKDYDFACIFDALHDMGDPVGATAHIKKSLKKDGTFMVVEPAAAGAAFSTDVVGTSYMLQGDALVNNDDPTATDPNDGGVWVQEGPHLMMLYPTKEMYANLPRDPDAGGPYVMWDNTPMVHVMVPIAARDN